MKKLVKQLEGKLIAKGKDLNITGQELMNTFYITLNDINQLFKNSNNNDIYWVYDTFTIQANTKYVNDLNQIFIFDDEVLWYKNNQPLYSSIGLQDKYGVEQLVKSEDKDDVTIKDLCLLCDYFKTDIWLQGELGLYSASLLKYFEAIKKIDNEESIELFLKYLKNYSVCFEFQKGTKIKVTYEEPIYGNAQYQNSNMLLYQLIILSYDTPIVETLKLLELY